MKEVADIQEPFAAFLRKHRICFIRNRPDKKSGIKTGWPDFSVIHMGRAVMVECKREKGVVSPAQAKCISELRFNGNTVVIAHSLEECIEAVKDIGVVDLRAPAIARKEGNTAVSIERGAELASKMVGDVKANVARSTAKGKSRLRQPKQPDLPENGKHQSRQDQEPDIQREERFPTERKVIEANFKIGRIGDKDWVLAPNLEDNWDRIREATPADVINLPKYAA